MRAVLVATASAAVLLLAPRAAAAQLVPRHVVDLSTPEKRQVAELSTQAVNAEVRGDFAQALDLADQALAIDANDAWVHYDRAVALSGLGRVDEAVSEYKIAQAGFGAEDLWGASIALYGRAHMLAEHLRCEEAEVAYEAYANLVSHDSPADAEMALTYASDCPLPGTVPVVSLNAAKAVQAKIALDEARRREAYARTIEQWVKRAESTATIASQPGAHVRLEAVRTRAESLEATAKKDEHAAMDRLAHAR